MKWNLIPRQGAVSFRRTLFDHLSLQFRQSSGHRSMKGRPLCAGAHYRLIRFINSTEGGNQGNQPWLRQAPIFAIRCVSRETLRLAVFLWTTPARAARNSEGSAATRAA